MASNFRWMGLFFRSTSILPGLWAIALSVIFAPFIFTLLPKTGSPLMNTAERVLVFAGILVIVNSGFRAFTISAQRELPE